MQKILLACARAIKHTTELKAIKPSTLFFAFLVAFVTANIYISIYAERAQALPNNTVNFQARLLKNTGSLIADGFYTVEFKIYNQQSGGTSSWTEVQAITTKNGYLTTSLGSVTPFGSNIDWSQEQWLSMNINGDGEMNPRMKITAVPLAFRAVQADSLTTSSGTVSSDNLVQIAPGAAQTANSANNLLRLNQTGSGGLLQLQSAGVDILTLSNGGDLAISRGITLGNSNNAVAGTLRWNGVAFEGYNGSTWAPLGGGSALGNPIINKVKQVTETQNSTVNATATLQNDDELFFSIGANETWTFRFMIQGNANATPDYKFAVSAPAGASCQVGYSDPEGATSISNLGCGITTGLIPGNTANDFYEIVGTVTNGSTAGTVQLLWAQNTANVANSVIYAGSSVLAIRSVGVNGTAQAFIQDGNSFGTTAVLGTNDANNLNIETNGQNRLTVLANGNIGIGDATPLALLTVGVNDALQVNNSGDITTSGTLAVSGLTTLNNGLVAKRSATTTTANTIGTGVNTTTVTLSADVFNVNDVVLIDNVGQDYYTRIIADPGTGTYTVSSAVTYEASRPVTKYIIQNIGATATDYTTQSNRFFEGYFLGGLVVGTGTTTISDGTINSTNALRLQQNGGDLMVGGALKVSGILSGDASGLTSLNATNITSGTLNSARLSTNVTLAGNTFNGANQLLQLNASGLVADSLLSTNITKLGNTFNGANQLVQLNASSALPALNGALLTSLNATNITSGTLNSARLSTNVTLAGNTFNGANQLLQLNASGALPALNGTNLTNIQTTSVSGQSLTLGNDTPQTGQLILNDAVASNGFTSVLGTNNLTASRNINLPNASGTICLEGSSSCGFIALAPTATQLDSTINNSIFINKTGASGNLVLLQKNSSDIFSIGNDGSTTLKLNSATALRVLNGSGVPVLTIDTNSGAVRIGNTTADGTGNLLVLDTKNTTGDPTGENGGMYYNSFGNAMRCYENNQWKNCIDETTVVKSVDQTITNNAVFQNDSNLALAMLANSTYTIDASINYSGTSATAGFKYTFTAPVGTTVNINSDAATTASTNTICNIATAGQTCTVLIANNFRGTIRLTGYIRTGATAGNLQFQFAQNTANAGQSVTIYQGSMIAYRKTQ